LKVQNIANQRRQRTPQNRHTDSSVIRPPGERLGNFPFEKQ
jgi:hypothetical protein